MRFEFIFSLSSISSDGEEKFFSSTFIVLFLFSALDFISLFFFGFFGFFVLFTCVLSLYRAPRVVRGSGGLGMNYTRFVMVVSGCACLLLAMAMAGVAGQRWAVDHYLAYQQPLLLAGLLIMSRASISFVWFWRVASLLVVLSIVLIYLRYPMSSRATYVKESIVLSPDVGRGDGALCARQHAGVEWVHSSLWGLCGGFGDD